MKKHLHSVLAVAFGAIAVSLPAASGQSVYSGSNNGFWQTPENWTPSGVPTGDAVINTATNVIVSDGTYTTGNVTVENPLATATSFSIIMAGAATTTLNVNRLTLGSSVAGGGFSGLQFNTANGTFNSTGNITLAPNAGHAQIVFSSAGVLNVGGGTGSIINGGGSGAARLDVRAIGVSINAASVGLDEIYMGLTGSNSLSINSGQAYTVGGNVNIAASTNVETSTLNLNGGSLTATNILLNSGNTNNSTAVFNLNGGTLSASAIKRNYDGASQQFNWNNGTVSNISTGNLTLSKAATATQNLVISLAGTGTHAFDVSDGKTASLESTAVLTDKIGENGTLTKSGLGTLSLAGTNTYTGVTTISAGTLVIASTGSIASSSAIDLGTNGTLNVSAVSGGFALANGQTLKGSGTVVGALTVGTGATLAIGNSPGTVTFDNNLTLSSGSINDFEINGLTAGLYDLAQGAAGSQTVNFGGTLNLVFQGGFNTVGAVKIFDFETYTGNFTAVNTSGLAGGYSATFDSLTGVVTVVPEPGTWALLATGLTVVMILRRRGAG